MNEYKLDLVFKGEIISTNKTNFIYKVDNIIIIKYLLECLLHNFDNYKIISEGAFLIYYLNGVHVNSYKVNKLTTITKEDVNFDEILCPVMGTLYLLKKVELKDVWKKEKEKEKEKKDSYLYSMAKEFIEENTVESSLVASLILEIYARENIKNEDLK